MTRQNMALQPLIYNGQVITEREDTVSLTDMWKAAGSQSGRAPSDWLALVSTGEFVACVEATLNAGISGIKATKGKGGGTFGHWQIGLAYAKYLSPEFHMACNVIVRERMEGRQAAPTSTLTVVRDAVGVFGAYQRLARLIGLDKNQAAISANQATLKRTGENVLADIGSTHLLAPEQSPLLTPTQLGERMGGLSGKRVNLLLVEVGLQVAAPHNKGGPSWEPTADGERFAKWMDTGKRHGDGAPVQQLKWTSDVMSILDRKAA